MADDKKAVAKGEPRAILPELSKEEQKARQQEDEQAEEKAENLPRVQDAPNGALAGLDTLRVKDPDGVTHDMESGYWNRNGERLEEEGWELLEEDKRQTSAKSAEKKK